MNSATHSAGERGIGGQASVAGHRLKPTPDTKNALKRVDAPARNPFQRVWHTRCRIHSATHSTGERGIGCRASVETDA
jgi:hypothetical protein